MPVSGDYREYVLEQLGRVVEDTVLDGPAHPAHCLELVGVAVQSPVAGAVEDLEVGERVVGVRVTRRVVRLGLRHGARGVRGRDGVGRGAVRAGRVAVARRAGVERSTLYRRYPQLLLQRLGRQHH